MLYSLRNLGEPAARLALKRAMVLEERAYFSPSNGR
jgi:hypothetical protein